MSIENKSPYDHLDDRPLAARLTDSRLFGHIAARDYGQTPVSSRFDFDNAYDLHPDELCRQPNNDGQPLSQAYIDAYTTARWTLVNHLRSGALYKSTDDFTEVIKAVHHQLAEDSGYNDLNSSQLNPEHYGQFRGNNRLPNGRYNASLRAAQIGENYGDEYSIDRLQEGAAFTYSTLYQRLPGISKDNQVFDTVKYSETREVYDYRFYYPPGGEALDEYMDKIVELGQQVQYCDTFSNTGKGQALDLIARQYQYGACARPFRQINNSLFMLLANAQVKSLGFPGVTHAEMDLVAQRLQPDSFSRYFCDRVHGQMP